MQITTKRILAYVLDIVLLSLISTVISMSPLNPNYDKTAELQLTYQESMDEWNKEISSIDLDESSTGVMEDAIKEYLNVSKDYAYEVNRLSIYDTIYTSIIIFLYFGVLAYFMDGSTLGKKIMNIKVTDEKENTPPVPILTIRAFILYGTIFNLLYLILAFILNKDAFLIAYTILSFISYGISIAIIASLLIRKDKRGLHDLIAHTKVEERK